MSERPYHPPPDGANALFGLIGIVIVGAMFGFGWMGVVLVVDSVIDYHIRLWHHNARLKDGK